MTNFPKHRFSSLVCLPQITKTGRGTGNLDTPQMTTATGPGRLAMSGPVIRFALVVTSLLGKACNFLVAVVAAACRLQPVSFVALRGRHENCLFLARERSTDHRTRLARTQRGKKGRETGARRGTTRWLDEPSSFG